MSVYAGVARDVRRLMGELTPAVEPVSLDEAYLDLAGTERLHGMIPAKSMARLTQRIERELGITASVGLSCNKFLAKLASDLDKPRGFAVIGRAEAKSFLRDKPVSMLRGAGEATVAKLAERGITRIGQLQDANPKELAARYGEMGSWLYRLANADDTRAIDADAEMKSVSSETTFEADITDYQELEDILWEQAERVSARAKAAEVGGRTVVLKLKTAKFQLKTRSASLPDPTQLAEVIFRTARVALRKEADGTAYRLLGVGIHQIRPEEECDPPDLVDTGATHRAAAERAIDKLRKRFGKEAVKKGRSLR
jgi:DNA polymerase-4